MHYLFGNVSVHGFTQHGPAGPRRGFTVVTPDGKRQDIFFDSESGIAAQDSAFEIARKAAGLPRTAVPVVVVS